MDMDNIGVLDFSLRKSTDSEDQPQILNEEPEVSKSQPQRTGKRLQRMRPADEKLRAIERIRGGESKASVARDINVPESTIRGWCKSETAIRRCLQMKSPYDSEAYSPSSSNGLPGNSSDEENNPRREQRKSAKKQKLEQANIDASLASNIMFQEHLHNLANGDVKASSELLWNWLMFNQRLLNQQLMPLLPNGQMADYKDAVLPMPLIEPGPDSERPRSADEAIAHGEKFLKWLEDCNDPSVTRFKVMQLKQLLSNLKASRK